MRVRARACACVCVTAPSIRLRGERGWPGSENAVESAVRTTLLEGLAGRSEKEGRW